jgi:hypothetical protein
VVLLFGLKMLLQTRASLLKRGSAFEENEISNLVDANKSNVPSLLLEFARWLLEIKVLFL